MERMLEGREEKAQPWWLCTVSFENRRVIDWCSEDYENRG
jgi:hypothetical protein